MKKPDMDTSYETLENAIEHVVVNGPEIYRTLYNNRSHKERILFELSLVIKAGRKIVDLGGGVGVHSVVGQISGSEFICIDNSISKNQRQIDAIKYAESFGVVFIEEDLLNMELPFEDNSLDAIVTFDCFEHLHHSPRNIYKQLVGKMKKGGVFVIGCPNAANILKRIRCLAGKNIWSVLDDWYFSTEFRGHVREPIIEDLKMIFNDIGLNNHKIYGRNFIGQMKYGNIINSLSYVLKYLPTLCSNIYIQGYKP